MEIYRMVLDTPKKIIKHLLNGDVLIYGIEVRNTGASIKGISNEFFIDKVVMNVKEKIPNLKVYSRECVNNRTLLMLSTNDLTKEYEEFHLSKGIN